MPATEYLFWRHISWKTVWQRECLMPHFDAALFDATFRTATTFAPDATLLDATLFEATFPSFRRRHHICAWSHILAPHCFDATFSLDATFGPTDLETSSFFHQILAFEMAPLTGRRLECMFWAAVIELARVVSTVTRYLLLDFVSWILCIKLRSTE